MANKGFYIKSVVAKGELVQDSLLLSEISDNKCYPNPSIILKI